MNNNENKNNESKTKRNKKHLALNISVAALATLGCVGTITFGSLWCSIRNNTGGGGGDTPTTDMVTVTFKDIGTNYTIKGLTGNKMTVKNGTTYGMLPTPESNDATKQFVNWVVDGAGQSSENPILLDTTVEPFFGPKDPSDDPVTISWQGNVIPDATTSEWKIDNLSDYHPGVTPFSPGKTFANYEEAMKQYAQDVSKNKEIYANDLMENWINRSCIQHEVFGYPNYDGAVDQLFASSTASGWTHYQWTSSDYNGKLNFIMTVSDASYDEVHKCILVSGRTQCVLDWTCTLTKPSSTDTAEDNGQSIYVMEYKNLPFVFDYKSYDYQSATYNSWGTHLPDDFIEFGGTGWAYDVDNWSIQTTRVLQIYDEQDGTSGFITIDHNHITGANNYSYFFDSKSIQYVDPPMILADDLLLWSISGYDPLLRSATTDGNGSYYFKNNTLAN